ncbi:hypothetical protein [Arenicella xantha]|uniref:DUF2946 family protein n=1 Tax=Arenicella xantha TaxID=644221 RepID=A0A395JP44_9GAMM|nr:hypothetical protein [Arenicella xantha]RBP51344.1 hypothetical protein DFR28_102764 [Arenicella xantha]
MHRPTKLTITHYWLLICLIGNLLLPSLVAANESLSETPTRVLLCTSQGYQWVELESAQVPSSEDSSQHCIYCVLSNDDTPYVVLDLVSDDFNYFRVDRPSLATNDAKTFLLPSEASARSPPFRL